MDDLTISSSVQAAAMQRVQPSAAATAVTPTPQATNVIKAGEYSQVKGTIDNKSMYVVQFRDSESGEVRMQYPSKKAASAYQKTASSVETKSETPAPQAESTPAPSTPTSSSDNSSGDEVTS